MSGLELAMSLADGCPECVLNVEPPRSAVPVENGWRCAYLCSDCGHAWTTDWNSESLISLENLVTTRASSDDEMCENRGTNKDGPGDSLLTQQVEVPGPRPTLIGAPD